VRVRDHDFPDEELGKVTPYGIYDVAANTGFVNVGADHDTAAFAVESIRRWWHTAGKQAYPAAGRLLITADAGGSSGYRTRAWKTELAGLSRETGLEITVCHFPPGTGRAPLSGTRSSTGCFPRSPGTGGAGPWCPHEVIVNTISAVTTATGLKVAAMLDTGRYPVKVKINDQQMKDLEGRILARHGFQGSWNYTIRPAPAATPEDLAPPAPPGPDRGALAPPALTGVPDFAAVVPAVTIAWQAAREHRLHLTRGGARIRGTGPAGPARLSLDAHVLATLYRQHLGMSCRRIGEILGVHESSVSLATGRIAPLLARQGITITPAGTRISTLGALRHYAAAAGVTLPYQPEHANHATVNQAASATR
jgi:hypothetical protein